MKVKDTKRGGLYRPTRIAGGQERMYYKRPPRLTAKQHIDRTEKWDNLNTRDMDMVRQFRANPNLVLLMRCLRGRRFHTDARYEIRHYVLLDPDSTLREIGKPPPYPAKRKVG